MIFMFQKKFSITRILHSIRKKCGYQSIHNQGSSMRNLRRVYADSRIYYITHSEFRNGEEFVRTYDHKNGYSLGWIKLNDLLYGKQKR